MSFDEDRKRKVPTVNPHWVKYQKMKFMKNLAIASSIIAVFGVVIFGVIKIANFAGKPAKPFDRDSFIAALENERNKARNEASENKQMELEEMCKNWIFYRNQILKAHQRGDEASADKYRRKFQEANGYLNEYNQVDVQRTLERLDN